MGGFYAQNTERTFITITFNGLEMSSYFTVLVRFNYGSMQFMTGTTQSELLVNTNLYVGTKAYSCQEDRDFYLKIRLIITSDVLNGFFQDTSKPLEQQYFQLEDTTSTGKTCLGLYVDFSETEFGILVYIDQTDTILLAYMNDPNQQIFNTQEIVNVVSSPTFLSPTSYNLSSLEAFYFVGSTQSFSSTTTLYTTDHGFVASFDYA